MGEVQSEGGGGEEEQQEGDYVTKREGRGMGGVFFNWREWGGGC